MAGRFCSRKDKSCISLLTWCMPRSPSKTLWTSMSFVRRDRIGWTKPTRTCEANDVDLGLKNKVAIVAASSKGLGRAVALELAREGAKISMCSRNREQIRQAVELI